MPYEDQLRDFVAHLKQRDRSPATIEGYRRDIRLFMQWFAEARGQTAQVEDIQGVDVACYREHLVSVQKARPATVKRKVEALRRLCQWAYRQKLLHDDVAADIGPVHLTPAKAPKGLAQTEVYAMLRVAGESPQGLGPRNYALVQLFLQAGLRVQEVNRLFMADLRISARNGVVRVRGKGRKEREVPLNTSARRALQRYLDERGKLHPECAVFVSQENEPLAIRTIQHIISSLAHRAGITRLEVSPHVLRHTFAHSYLKQHPGRLDALALLLGHESLDTAAIYTRPSAEELAQHLEESPLNAYARD